MITKEKHWKPPFSPAYLQLQKTGELAKRAKKTWDSMEACQLCPRKCKANRLSGKRGICGANNLLEVSSCNPHFGEEKPLVGTYGSGTIFFTHCSLQCLYCQNWDISQSGQGAVISIAELASIMLQLQGQGCHNINLVTPDHYLPHILKAIDIAATEGLHIPIVYNTGGWILPETLKLLDGIVDIYMPDFKYWDPEKANRFSPGSKSYPELCRNALLEMHRQVGVAQIGADGILYRGLLIRHLVLPNNVNGTKEIINWIAKYLPKDTYLNLMSQYHPAFQARSMNTINRRINKNEYLDAIKWANIAGLTHVETQPLPHGNDNE